MCPGSSNRGVLLVTGNQTMRTLSTFALLISWAFSAVADDNVGPTRDAFVATQDPLGEVGHESRLSGPELVARPEHSVLLHGAGVADHSL